MSVALLQRSVDTRRMTDKTYCTINEAAELLGVHPVTLRRMVKRGQLKAMRVGRLWRVETSQLKAVRVPQPEKEPRDPTRKGAAYYRALAGHPPLARRSSLIERERQYESARYIRLNSNQIAERDALADDRYTVILTAHGDRPERLISRLLEFLREGRTL